MLRGARYSEVGGVATWGTTNWQGFRSEMDLLGAVEEIKTLYQQMMRFM